MLLKSATVAAGLLAASANAFLIPPEITETDLEIIDAIVPIPNDATESVDIKLNCPGCPVIVNGHRVPKFMEAQPHHLDLTFNVEHHPESADRLLVNGFELYPNPDPLSQALAATPLLDHPPWAAKGKGKWSPPWGKWGHHKDEKKEHHGHHGHHRGPFGRMRPQPQPLGFSLHAGSLTKEADSQLELIEVDLKIIEVGGEFIKGIPEIHVRLIRDPSGRLMIGAVEKDKAEALATQSQPQPLEECNTLLCKWMAAIFGSNRKPCHGQRPGSAPQPPVVSEDVKEDQDLPVILSGDIKYAPERTWGQLLKSVMSHIILPVLIGIVAGVSVSLIGMAVGTLIVSAWKVVRRHKHKRHHHRRHHSHKSVQIEPSVIEEKQTLMDNVEPEDAPPAYEDQVVKKADEQEV